MLISHKYSFSNPHSLIRINNLFTYHKRIKFDESAADDQEHNDILNYLNYRNNKYKKINTIFDKFYEVPSILVFYDNHIAVVVRTIDELFFIPTVVFTDIIGPVLDANIILIQDVPDDILDKLRSANYPPDD